ncbi:MAG TPA: YeeE/YedE family protein, partial [Ramlibacter sp.]|nr:YeeE/YedE family protein [Ramlibacter sp.]
MTLAELGTLTQQVLWAAFAVSAGFGALVQRTGFCTMGAVTDAVALGDWTRMRQWGLASGVAMIGFGLLVWSGQVDPGLALYSAPRWIWLSALTGGFIFGFGMVLASGCASKTLVRLGAGNLKALVVTLVIGISAFATLKGLTAVWRTATVDRVAVDFATSASLPAWASQAFGVPPASASLALGLLLGGALVAWALAGREFIRGNNLLAGAGVGGLVVAMWWLTGHFGFVAEHPETLQETVLATNSTRAEALSFVSPIAYALDWLMFYSDRNKLLTVGIVSVAGVISGSAVVALLQRSFRWEGFAGNADLG